MYEIAFDEKEGLLRRRLWGFWTPDTVERYFAELEALIARVKSRHPAFKTLSDTTAFRVQAAEVTSAFTLAAKRGGTVGGGKMAIVTGSILAKLQAERIYPFPNVRCFVDEERAREWLFDERS